MSEVQQEHAYQAISPDAARRYIMSLVAHLEEQPDPIDAYLVKKLILEMSEECDDPADLPDEMQITLSNMSAEVQAAVERITTMMWPHPDDPSWQIRPFIIELEHGVENTAGHFEIPAVTVSPTRWWFAFMEGKAAKFLQEAA